MALSQELDELIKSMDLDQGNGGFAAEKPGSDMLKKGEEDEAGGELAKSEADDEEDPEEGDDDMDKSLSGRLRKDDNLAKSIDAAPIIDELIAGIDDLADGLKKSLDDTAAQQNVVNEALVKGLSKSLQLLHEQGNVIKSLADQVATLGGRPAAPRKAALAGTPVLEKGMGGVTQESGMPREVVQTKLVKGIGAGVIAPEWAQAFDRSGEVPAHVMELIKAL